MSLNFKLASYYRVSAILLIYSLGSAITTEHVLDVSYPIVIAEDGEASAKLSESHFGYTVSLVRGKSFGEGKSSQDPDGWIFIGAPNASTTIYDSYSGEPMKAGVIWRCSLGRSPNIGDTCEVVNIDPDPSPAKRPKPGPSVESFDGAWIGGSMEINHGRLLTCGMRWNRGRNQFYNGICYWFSDAKKSSYLSSDLSELVDKRTYEQRLTPFFRSDINQDRLFNFTLNNQVEQAHEWQISQAGVSTHLFTDKTLGSSLPNLLIGAPGVREWSGAVVLYTNNKNPRPEMIRPNRNVDDTDATFSEFVVGNRGQLPESEGFIRSYSHEYFGYSVSSGRYLSKDKVLYSAGSPRGADHSGEVILFDFPPYQQPTSTYKRQIIPHLEIQAPENSFASYFGSVLHSIDLDGNGLDELIVGAPLYTFFSRSSKDTARVEEVELAGTERDKPKLGNFQEYGDHGCVFVYQFKSSKDNENIAKESSRPLQVLMGSKIPRARFGSAISSLEFDKKDSKEHKEIYLVIGAPYEISYTNDDWTSGAVYLYLFNPKTGKFGSFSQRIVASSISSSLNGFGSSLSISKDVDDNSTPDIAIGAYKSGHSVILRTRPKIELKSWINFSPPEGNKEVTEIRRGVSHFFLKSCFSVSEKLGLVAQKLDIWVKVRITDHSIKFHQEVINARPGNTENEVIYTRNIDAHIAENCTTLTVVSENPLIGIGMDESDTLTVIKHPLRFHQEVWYNETLNRPLSVINYIAKGSRDIRKRNAKLNFHSFDKGKPSPQVAKNTADLSISPTDCRDPVCRPDIETTWAFYNDKDEKISAFEIGPTKDIKLNIFLLNSGETAAYPNLTLDWGITDIRESFEGSRWIHRMCEDHSSSSRRTYTCSLGAYIKKGKNTTIEIRFAVEDVYVQQSKSFKFEVNGIISFKDKHIEVFKSSGSILAVVPPTMVKVTGSRENDTFRNPLGYMTLTNQKLFNEGISSGGKTTTLYAAVRQRFTVEVKGASVKEVVAKFKIPVMQSNLKSGKAEQLILVKLLHQSGKEISCKTNAARSRFLMLDSVNPQDKSLTYAVHHKETKNFIQEIQPLPGSVQRRRRRDALNDNVTTSNPLPEASSETPQISIYMKPLAPPVKQAKMEAAPDALKLLCDNSEASCLEVICTLLNVKANLHVHIPFELYLIKDAIDNILQSSGKTSLLIESTGSAYIFNAGKHHEHSDVSQTAMVKISGREVEAWWIVVAVFCGIFLVTLISVVLYKCGFFKREKRQQLNDMKAEHRRKSMIATARQSVMQAGSSADGGLSLEELMETEHRNEDKEPDEIQEDVKT